LALHLGERFSGQPYLPGGHRDFGHGREPSEEGLLFLVSFAVGGLFGDVFIHILPEAFEKAASPLRVSFGIRLASLCFLFLKNLFIGGIAIRASAICTASPLSGSTLIGDGFHNFIDALLSAPAIPSVSLSA
jgi:hypothetical protein